jgi:hypothetical protein
MEYKNYAAYLAELFPGVKVQKISINAGFQCPNRDGTIGVGGCIYCNNKAFSPAYCHEEHDVARQIAEGRAFFSRKYKEMKYLAYFQNYTNSYESVARLRALYMEALSQEDVVGLVIGTRPDCVSEECLDMLAALDAVVMVEYGAESSHDATLRLINRGHTWEDTVRAVTLTAAKGLRCGLHLIAGLPGESDDDVLTTVERACRLPIDSLKLHHLQVLWGTRLASMVERNEIEVVPYTPERYLDLCVKIVAMVPPHIAIERFLAQSPPQMVIMPKWNLKNYQFTNLLANRLKADPSPL